MVQIGGLWALDAAGGRLALAGPGDRLPGRAGPSGESSRVHLLRCTALNVPMHALAPCALHLHPPGLVRNAG